VKFQHFSGTKKNAEDRNIYTLFVILSIPTTNKQQLTERKNKTVLTDMIEVRTHFYYNYNTRLGKFIPSQEA